MVGALMGASINAALRQQEKPYNRPDGRGNAIPLWWLAPPRCPVGSMSLDSRVAGLPYESSSFATPTSWGHYKAPLCCERLMKGLLFRPLLSHRSAVARELDSQGAKRPENRVTRFPVDAQRT